MAVHPDSPITSSAEDALSRSDYAKGIADSILAYAPTDSVVLALVGPWGSGKSSVINMVEENLPNPDAGGPIVVRFNPWRYSGSDYLLASFFSTLARRIGAYDKIALLKNASAKMQRASQALGFLKIIPKAGAVFAKLGGFLKLGSENIQELVADVGTLDALHDDLAAELRGAQKRILVVIDDIDRLAAPEILQVFQLVKSLADFPYVMYLVAYDESVVLRAVDPDPTTARSYLEKIVSLSVPVPPADQHVIDNMVLGNILETLRPELPPFYAEERLFGQYINGFRPYLATMRDVRRFLNGFEFNYARSKDDVDIGDLAGLTALQVFERPLYDAIHLEPDAFIDNQVAIWRGDREKPQDNKKRLDAILDRVTLADRTNAIETLRQLFHKVDLAYKGHAYNFTGGQDTKEHRVSSSEHFPRFFNVGSGPSELSKAEYEQALRQALTDITGIPPMMEALGTDKAADFVQKVRKDESVLNLDDPQREQLIMAILALANQLSPKIAMTPLVPFDWTVGYAVDHVLDGLTGQRWVDVMRSVTESLAIGIGEAASYVDLIARLHEKGDSRSPGLTDKHITALKEAVVAKAEALLRAGALQKDSHLARLIHCLRSWGKAEPLAEITGAIRDQPEMLMSFLASSRQRGGFEGYLKPKPFRFSLEFTDSVIPRNQCREALTRLKVECFGNDEQRRVIDGYLLQSSPDFDEDAED